MCVEKTEEKRRMLKPLLKDIILKLPRGKELLAQRSLRKTAFTPCSGGLFSYLDKNSQNKTVHGVYNDAFDKIFFLVRSFHFEGDFYEFGAFSGYTSKLIAMRMKLFEFNDASLHVFDSFEGLPEVSGDASSSYEVSKGIWSKGAMGALPKGIHQYIQKELAKILSHEHVDVVKGFFEQTVTKHFREKACKKARLVHVDCDLYTSSKCALTALFENDLVQDGTVFIFDDWMTSLGNPNLGQRKAVAEILKDYPSWSLEFYINYGIGSTVFTAHDKRVEKTTASNA